MSTISWLHLSDWHQKGPDFDRQVVRDKLIMDIKNRHEIDRELKQVDFVVFSGDAAFAGQAAEFESAKLNLFDPVLQALELQAEKLFFVPGNHDLDRHTIAEMLPSALQEPLRTDAEVQHWLTDDRRRMRVLEPFESYHTFVSGYTGQEAPAFASTKTMDLAGHSVAVLGLNSAWLCSRSKDGRRMVNDYGHLAVGEPQIHEALDQIGDYDLRIIVIHHPFDWLAEFDRNRVEERLKHDADFILFGHQHVPKLEVIRGTSGECVIVPAGAAYDRRVPSESRYTNAYNFVRLDPGVRRGVAYLRRWNDRSTRWTEDTDTYAGGCYEFELPDRLGATEAASGQVRRSIKGVERAESSRIEAAERRYRELLLESCDIIDLANLPEQDRHIAQRQLELRRLYVPLRVQVEVPAQADASDEIWEVLEKRRGSRFQVAYDEVGGTGDERAAVGERLVAARRLVILGDPGAGKTTLTRWIATAYLLRLKSDPDWRGLPDVQTLPDADWLPILVRCRDLDMTCLRGALDDVLKHTLRKEELREDQAEYVQQVLRHKIDLKEVLLIFDGLDEIVDPAVRARFCGQIDKIASAHPDLAIIATSRVVGYREMGRRLARGFEHLTLADLTGDEKDEFARRWCELTERPERRAAAAAELIDDIHSSDRIERLTGNPMLLTTMALVKRKVGKLPQRRADLYSEAVQVLLNWRREVDEPLDYREAIPQLEYLAYAMCDRGVQQLREDEAIELFVQMRQEFPKVHAAQSRSPEAFLRLLEARTGILIEAGHVQHLGRSVPVLEFRHLTFQEYLAARALVDGRFPNRNVLLSLAECVAPLAGRVSSEEIPGDFGGEPSVVESWREALRLCVAICNDDDVDDVLLSILEPLEGEPSSTRRARAIQAALCLADEPNASAEVAERIARSFATSVGPFDGAGFAHNTLERAAVELAKTRWLAVFVQALITEFFQRDVAARSSAGGLCGMIARAEAPNDEAELTRWLAKQIRQLKQADEHVAAKAALSVMQLAYEGKVKTVPGLVTALFARLSGSGPMASAAAWTLGWLYDPNNRHRLWQPSDSELNQITAFVSDQGADVEAIRFLLWTIRGERAELPIPLLIARLSDAHSGLRREVARTLGAFGSDQAIEPLAATLDDADDRVRDAAASALVEIGSQRAVDALAARLDDKNHAVRHAAASALGEIGSEWAVDALVAHLDNEDAEVRHAATRALGEVESERAVDALVTRLDDNDAKVRRAALEGLAHRLPQLDQRLLSRDFDGLHPFLDPREPIYPERILKAAAELELSEDEIERRYETLTEHYGLQLERPAAE
jgi:predicted phosphodiesterase